MIHDSTGLECHRLVGLATTLAALGVAQLHEDRAGILDHPHGYLAGSGTLLRPVRVLGAEQDRAAAGQPVAHSSQGGVRREEEGLDPRGHRGCSQLVDDTTGAGDTFVGVLAASLAAGATMVQAMRRAVAASALAVGLPGAVPSIPTRTAVDERLNRDQLSPAGGGTS